MKQKNKLSLRHFNPVTVSNLTSEEESDIIGGAGTAQISVCVCPTHLCDEGDPSGTGDGLG